MIYWLRLIVCIQTIWTAILRVGAVEADSDKDVGYV